MSSPWAKKDCLWDKVVSELSYEDRQMFKICGEPHIKILDDIQSKVKTCRDECLRKKWKIKGFRGREIVVRDICAKLMSHIDSYLHVIDIAVQYDPVHAALPWAGIRFLFRIALNSTETFEAMIEGLETASDVITRCTIMEMLYLPAVSDAQKTFENRLRKLYGVLIRYLCKAKQYFSEGSFMERFFVDTVQREDFESALKAISEEDLNVKHHRELIDAERLKTSVTLTDSISKTINSLDIEVSDGQSLLAALQKKLQDLESTVFRADSRIERLYVALEESEKAHLLRWLSGVNIARHHQAMLSGVLPDSGAWLLNAPEFTSWRASSSSGIFWLHGIQGCGKSRLLAMVIESFKQNHVPSTNTSPLAYFYCSRDTAEPERSNCDEIFRAVVKQLSLGDNGKIMSSTAKGYQNKLESSKEAGLDLLPLTLEECVAAIAELTATSPTTIVIDALDECDLLQRKNVMLALDKIVAKSIGVVKILISGREEDDITIRLNQEPGIHITSEQNGKDLIRFIEIKVKDFILEWSRKTGRNSHELEKLEDHIVAALKHGAQGMFLWVTLQLEAIQNTDRIKFDEDVEAAMSHLPRSLTASYDAVHDRVMAMEQTSRKVATSALQWLLCSRRTLNVQEFVAAVSRSDESSLHLSPSRIPSCCCNLIVLDPNLDAFRFAHPSVRRYLESRPEYDAIRINSAVITRCLNTYVWGNCSSDPLLEYATIFWPAHYEAALTSDRGTNFDSLLLRFFTEEEHFEDWHDTLRAANLDEPRAFWSFDYQQKLHSALSSPPSPLFAICSFGYLEVLEYLLSNLLLPDLEIANKYNARGLYLAACSGHNDLVECLIRHHCDINSPGGRFGTAIKAAANAGHASVVRLLLNRGASTSCDSGEYGDPMQAALAGGHQNVVQMLFENCFTFSTQTEFDNALQLASFNGNVDAVEQLLDGQAGDFSTADSHVPLQVALYGRKEKASKRLIDACQDVNDTQGYFGNALQSAIAGGKLGLVKLVLEKGGNPNIRGRFGYPLRAAAIRGQDDIVKLLLDHGASPNTKDTELGDPLQAAASKGHLSTMSILIDHKANIEGFGGPFNSPLEAAVRAGHMQATMLLRDKMEPSYFWWSSGGSSGGSGGDSENPWPRDPHN
ncbi:hypothetical protein IWZ01DRAFT_43965 [Phyllosticta capitalensis]